MLINLNQNLTILAHLGMTGKFFILDEKNKKHKTSFYYSVKKDESKHDHITFYLSQGYKLIYNDVRKFGFIKLYESKKVYQCNHLKSLGPEPLTKLFNLKYITKYFLCKKKNIKDIFTKVLKGHIAVAKTNLKKDNIGSKINPQRTANNIKKKDLINMMMFTKKILKKSIIEGGSSIKNFT